MSRKLLTPCCRIMVLSWAQEGPSCEIIQVEALPAKSWFQVRPRKAPPAKSWFRAAEELSPPPPHIRKKSRKRHGYLFLRSPRCPFRAKELLCNITQNDLAAICDRRSTAIGFQRSTTWKYPKIDHEQVLSSHKCGGNDLGSFSYSES